MAREKRSVPGASENSSEKKGKVEGETEAYDKRAIPVTVDPEVLQCDACYGTLVPPLFQCVRGHLTCSTCISDSGYECQWCHTPETTFRCRVMEYFLASLNVPCTFKYKGCTAMIPYGDNKLHESSCFYTPCYCPIRGCSAHYSGVSLLNHLEHKHPEIGRTYVKPNVHSPLVLCDGEPACLVCLADDDTAVFLIVVDRSEMPAGRSLSVVRLKAELREEEEEKKQFGYKITVTAKAGNLSLSGDAETIGRLTAPYKASSFLFLPDAMLDAHTEGLPIILELM
ncbi:hypothetical protein ABZP36_016886 [Zizania latifolia]